MEQIKIVRLKTGMDIIGSITEDGYNIIIKNALIVEVHDDLKNQRQILTLSQWAPSSIIKDNTCMIFENDILCKFVPTEQFVQHYLGMVEAMADLDITKKRTDEMSDEEIGSLIEAMEEREHSTLQ